MDGMTAGGVSYNYLRGQSWRETNGTAEQMKPRAKLMGCEIPNVAWWRAAGNCFLLFYLGWARGVE